VRGQRTCPQVRICCSPILCNRILVRLTRFLTKNEIPFFEIVDHDLKWKLPILPSLLCMGDERGHLFKRRSSIIAHRPKRFIRQIGCVVGFAGMCVGGGIRAVLWATLDDLAECPNSISLRCSVDRNSLITTRMVVSRAADSLLEMRPSVCVQSDTFIDSWQ
jgi:hypothetical protein